MTARDILTTGLEELKNRGYDAWGICVGSHVKTSILEKYVNEKKLTSCHDESKTSLLQCFGHGGDLQYNRGCGHTRWATHGRNCLENTHPFICFQHRFFLVHNGIVSNFVELREVFHKRHPSVSLESQTDSEIVVHLLQDYVSQSERPYDATCVTHAFTRIISLIQGTYAFVLMDRYLPEYLWAARSSSPLWMTYNETRTCVYMSSELHGLTSMMQMRGEQCLRVHFLEEGHVYCFSASSTTQYIVQKNTPSHHGNEEWISCQDIDHDQEAPAYFEILNTAVRTHDFWTLQEIEQGALILDNQDQHYPQTILNQWVDYLKDARHVIFVGCGSSLFACQWSSHSFWTLPHIQSIQCWDASLIDISAFRTVPNIVWIFVSQSGETHDVLTCIRELCQKDPHGRRLALVNAPMSMMVQLLHKSHCAFLMCGRERGVASTKSFLAQLLFFKRVTDQFSQSSHSNAISQTTSSSMSRLLEWKSTISPTWKQWLDIWQTRLDTYPVLSLMGVKQDVYLCHEIALKMKELCYISTEAISAPSLKHGPLAIVDKKSTFFVLCTNVDYISLLQSSLYEISSRGAYSWLFTFVDIPIDFPNVTIIPMKSIFQQQHHDNTFFMSCHLLLWFQWLTYEWAIQRGCDPDFPRHLAKCVTV